MNMETKILDLLHESAPNQLTAKAIAKAIGEKDASVKAHCSRLHKHKAIRAESIWIETTRPARPMPTLFYFVR